MRRGLKRSHAVTRTTVLVGGHTEPDYSLPGRWYFPPFSHPEGSLKELCSPTPEMCGQCTTGLQTSLKMAFEDRHPFILKAFTYLQAHAKATRFLNKHIHCMKFPKE